ncbi:MAG: proton-conducting transporter membrane subunit [Clostridia bacterium]
MSALVISLSAGLLAWRYFAVPQQLLLPNGSFLNPVFLVLEVLICAAVVFFSIKNKRVLPIILSVVQTVAVFAFELFFKSESGMEYLAVDKLSVIMALIIGVIGSLICLFAVPYMEDFHKHHTECADKSGQFIALLYVVIAARFGIIFSNDLIWLSVFWEVTTLASFIFIKYTGTDEAIKNAFCALNLNLIGGAAIAGAIVILGIGYGVGDLATLVDMQTREPLFMTAVLLLSIAGISKAAQFPFSKWLLGAMVAPTPTSALLHSSTMVKAGVFLLIKISPLMQNTAVGLLMVLIGGMTFLCASIMAIAQTDAKKTLANSTIANLGLIVACSGVGGYEALWAAVFLLIFHAIAKSLLFLSVGTIEHQIGSRDIEDMHGLIVRLPVMAFFMAVGIAGMFLAPFGMLISKWATLKAFVDSQNILLVVLLVFGSAATVFYWTKWLGNIGAVLPKSERIHYKMPINVKITFGIQAGLTMLLCLLFPLVSDYMISPYLTEVMGLQDVTVISGGNQIIMMIMMGMIIILPFAMHFISSRDDRITSAYMGGVNAGDGRHFIDAHGHKKRMYLSNWYMPDLINERAITRVCVCVSILLIAACFALQIGGLL